MTMDIRTAVQEPEGPQGRWPDDALVLGRLVAQRHSCRGFRPEPLPRATIERMLAIAQLSPSWCNSQPWQVIVTEGQGTERLRTALYEHACANAGNQQAGAPAQQPDLPFPTAYRGVYKERQREVGWQLYESVGVANGDRRASAAEALKNFRLFDAPHMALITTERDLGTYGAVDCGIYLGHLLLAAQSLGIAAIPQAALAAFAPFMREHFQIPEERLIVAGVSFGLSQEDHPANAFRSKRADLSTVVRWVSE